MATKVKTEVRPVNEIAREISKDWKNVHPYAKPYLEAMYSLNSVDDTYIVESGKSIVLYFLNSASSWRGDVARRIKAELKAMCK